MIIPLEKLIEYKGNRYELARAMIELARNGKGLLYNESKVNKGKYIPVVIKNLMEGRIKYEYGKEHQSPVDVHAPFTHSSEVYDETKFHIPEPEVAPIDASADNADDAMDDDAGDTALESEVYEADDEIEEDIDASDEVDETEEAGAEKAAAPGDEKKAVKKPAKKPAKKTVKKAAPKKAKK